MLFEHPSLPSAIIRFSEPSCFDNFRAAILNDDANPGTNGPGLKRIKTKSFETQPISQHHQFSFFTIKRILADDHPTSTTFDLKSDQQV